MIRKVAFFEGWSCFKVNNFGLALGTNLKFYNSLSKGLKLKVRQCWGLIPTFVEVTGEKLAMRSITWDTHSCMMIISNFYKFVIVMDAIIAYDFFQVCAFPKEYNGNCAKGFFTTLICL